MEKIKEFYSELVKNDEFKTKLTQFRQENGDDYEKIIENVVLPQAKKWAITLQNKIFSPMKKKMNPVA